ncbi:MAG: hemolysin family protein [Desulfatiglandales bacterium]
MFELALAFCFAVIISGACSLFEAVLYSVPMRHVESLVRSNPSVGRVLKELRQNVEKPITAILSLNTIANTAGAAVAGAAAIAVFGYDWIGVFSAFFTLSILVFSEVIPKTAGVVYARRLAPYVAYPLKGLVVLMAPAIWLCGHVTQLIFRHRDQDTVSPDELKVMAQLGFQSGSIQPYQKRVIENILSLQNKAVKQVMTPRTVIFSLSEHLTAQEAADLVKRWEHSRFPVYDQDAEDIVGIVLTRELLMALSQGKGDTHLTDLMAPVQFIVETVRLDQVFRQFMGSRQKLFVVIDEYGGLSGVVTLEDILEEILGREIMDESDEVADKRELARSRRSQLVSSEQAGKDKAQKS